jgi:hypothetical protein
MALAGVGEEESALEGDGEALRAPASVSGLAIGRGGSASRLNGDDVTAVTGGNPTDVALFPPPVASSTHGSPRPTPSGRNHS